jgi:hypothetical protein
LEDRAVPASPVVLLNNIGNQGATLRGFENGGYAGYSASMAGDVNGDGFDDMVIGSHLIDGAGTDRGEIYVVFGAANRSGASFTLSSLGTNGFTIRGFQDAAYAGFSVAGAGDFNGDGFADIVIGAHQTDAGGINRGEAYVVFGSPNRAGTTLALNTIGTNGFTMRGFENYSGAGISVSGAGDVNGDGISDIILGAPLVESSGTDRGEAYVVFGKSTRANTTMTLSNLGTNGFTLRGFDDGGYAGTNVSGAGDVNGDGFADVIVGAMNAAAGGSNGGEAYVVFGGTALAATSLTLSNLGAGGFTIRGFESSARAGHQVAKAGDINGDGFDDVFVGAYRTNVGGTDRGEAYVVFGAANRAGTTLTLNALGAAGLTLRGFEDNALAGKSVSGAGDVNGDGLVDIILGAPFTASGGTKRGESYVVYGDANRPGTTLTLNNLGTNGFTIRGFENTGYAGQSVSGAGDVNGDGFADLLVGAPGTNSSGTNRGEAYLVYAPAPGVTVVGTDSGTAATVRVYDSRTGVLKAQLQPFGGFAGGVRVATGDVNHDGALDIIAAAGPGGGPQVLVFDGRTFAVIRNFFAYAPGFTGGVYVASGDTNGDGFAEIITGVGVGGGPHVRVWDGVTGNERYGFFAYNPNFLSGVIVTAGDLDNDGRTEIITGAGPGGGPHVRVWNPETTTERFGFFAYATSFLGGVYVSAADVNGDGKAEIITGAGAGGGPHVRVFSTTGAAMQSFFAYSTSFTGGVRVATADVDGDGRADIITGAGPSGGPHVRAFRGSDRAPLKSFFAFDPSFLGGVYVG